MSSPETIAVAVIGAVAGVLVATGVLGPTLLFSDAGYAMVGVIASALIGGTATVLVTYITVNSNRRSRDRDSPPDDPARKSP